LTLFLALMTLFIVKHFLFDFLWQFAYMVQNKGVYGHEGGVHHSMLHALGTVIVLIMFYNLAVHQLSVDTAGMIVVFGAVDGVVHYHIDWLKQQINERYKTSDPEFWHYLGIDQALHNLTYVVLTYFVLAGVLS